MSANGLLLGDNKLHTIGLDGSTCCQDGYESEEIKTAEFVFRANAKVRDYHDNMDSFMFMNWVRLHLIPAFKAQYGKRIMVLVLDNAPYHHSHPDDGINVRKLTKPGCVALLKKGEFKLPSFDAEREFETRTFKSKDYDTAAPKGPYVDELRDILLQQIKDIDPTRLMTELQLLFKEEGYELIFTPPYMYVISNYHECA